VPGRRDLHLRGRVQAGRCSQERTFQGELVRNETEYDISVSGQGFDLDVEQTSALEEGESRTEVALETPAGDVAVAVTLPPPEEPEP
jgi:hypothetical protein